MDSIANIFRDSVGILSTSNNLTVFFLKEAVMFWQTSFGWLLPIWFLVDKHTKNVGAVFINICVFICFWLLRKYFKMSYQLFYLRLILSSCKMFFPIDDGSYYKFLISQYISLITRLIVINIGPLTELFFNYPLFSNCPLPGF